MSAELRLTVLSDNRSSNPARFPTEHGLSILLDAGGLGAFLEVNSKAKVIVSSEALGKGFFSTKGGLPPAD